MDFSSQILYTQNTGFNFLQEVMKQIMKRTRRIIAMGGGGFTMEQGNPLFDDYILEKARVANPHICLLPTASGDHEEYLQGFYDLFSNRKCTPTHASLFHPPVQPADVANHLMKQDIIYVSGGHTEMMIRIWKTYGIDRVLYDAWKAGILLAGVSSGGVCWFEEGVTDSNPQELDREECLGFLSGSFCAHYENEGRRPTFHRLIQEKRLAEGVGVENFAALYYEDDTLEEIIASRPCAAAYEVTRRDGRINEKALDASYLGNVKMNRR